MKAEMQIMQYQLTGYPVIHLHLNLHHLYSMVQLIEDLVRVLLQHHNMNMHRNTLGFLAGYTVYLSRGI